MSAQPNPLPLRLIEQVRCICCGNVLKEGELRSTPRGEYADSGSGLCGYCKGDRDLRLAVDFSEGESTDE